MACRKFSLPTINNKKIDVGTYDEISVLSFCSKIILAGMQCDILCSQCALKNEYSYIEYQKQQELINKDDCIKEVKDRNDINKNILQKRHCEV